METLQVILQAMYDKGWGADNLAFGSGGALLQKLHRDTSKCAFKCSYACVNGEDVDVWKHPVTDKGKVSKKGRMTLEFADGKWTTIEQGKGDLAKDMLQVVFKDGHLQSDQTFAEIRGRSNA